jgi:RNA polymerase sigma-70 factor (ECF subfamily)
VTHRDDLALAERVLGGDEAAFDEFAARCVKPLYRFASRRLAGERELVQEIVQTTLAKALARLDSYRGTAALFTWLCSCCLNEIRMHWRTRKTAPTEVPADDAAVAEAEATVLPFVRPANPEDDLLETEAAERVHLTLDLLPDHYADALRWKYLEHLPVAEIAERLDLGTKAAESLLTRSRAAFRQRYESLPERSLPRAEEG